MINRQNWLDVRVYLRYIERMRQLDAETVVRSRAHLRHLLEWADETPLGKVPKIDPTFPVYLLAVPLASSSIIRGLSVVRGFYTFARVEWPGRYRATTDSWISMLQPPRLARADSQLRTHQFWSVEDVLKVAAVSTETLRQERGKVAVCMLFLSGMRADALATLPVSCVDLAAGQVVQDPQQGVRTKNRKAAITYFLDIPDLMKVVADWDRRVRALSPGALWYATLTSDAMTITETTRAFAGRNNVVERDVRLICALTGVPYLSPHKLRHGHVVYALKKARNMAEMKAISQNVMHASVTITDQVYGNLIGDDIKSTIAGLGQRSSDDISARLTELVELLKAQ